MKKAVLTLFTFCWICFSLHGQASRPPLLTEIIAKPKVSRSALIQDFHFFSKADVYKQNPADTFTFSHPLYKAKKCHRFLSESLRKSAERNSGNRFENIFILDYEINYNTDSLIAALNSSGDYEYAEYNRVVKLDFSKNPSVVHINDPFAGTQWYLSRIAADEAWNVTKGNSNILIGYVDTGIDYFHPDLKNQIFIKNNEPVDGLDSDGNGYIDDRMGYDFTDQPRFPYGGDYLFEDEDPFDEYGHGTIVAGILAAEQNNNYGISGVAPGCKLVPLRAFSGAMGEDDDISRAILYAADNGIKILNFSFGDIYPSILMHETIKYAYEKGVVMIASAGNTTGDDVHYPSNYPEVISVSASSYNPDTDFETIWSVSNYGLTVDLCAPGADIYTTYLYDADAPPDSSFGAFSGTSTSAPMVTGAAALLRSQDASLSPKQIRGILTTSADDVTVPGGTGWDHYTGAGRVNVAQALKTIGASIVGISSPQNDSGSKNDTLYITGTVLDPMFESYVLEYAAGTENITAWTPVSSGMFYQKSEDILAIWNLSGLPDTTYTLRLKVNRTDGFTSEDRVRFLRDKTPPSVQIKFETICLDNNEEKEFLVYRSSDAGINQLFYKSSGSVDWQTETFDKKTRSGYFLLSNSLIVPNQSYDFFVRCTNASGLTGYSDTLIFSTTNFFVNPHGFDTTNYFVPFGRYLSRAFDFDQDGNKEVVMNRYNNQFGLTKIYFYEKNLQFIPADSLQYFPASTLIPKDVADINGDGRLELLASVNDSLYVFTQSTNTSFPKTLFYKNEGNNYYPAGFADLDKDGKYEIITKGAANYYVLEYNASGNSFNYAATLEDVSAFCNWGSTAPQFVSDDFDGDGNKEIVFGTYCGNILIYEASGNDSYVLRYQDSTGLYDTGNYLAKGDFDGDGKPEFFVAARTSLLRNDDFEYDAPYWYLRIFKSNANDIYSVIWEKYIFEIASDHYNALSAGDMDSNPATDEILLTLYPKTYIISSEGSGFGFKWFYYGSVATYHVIDDFNGNGINEFALGTVNYANFFEPDYTYNGPEISPWITGYVRNNTTAVLNWQQSGNKTWSTQYILFRGSGTTLLVNPIDTIPDTFFADTGLTEDSLFVYAVRSYDTTFPVSTSDYSYGLFVRPHEKNRLDSVRFTGNNKILAYFRYPMSNGNLSLKYFLLSSGKYPVSAVVAGNNSGKVLLGFKEYLADGTDTLIADTLLLDSDMGLLDPAFSKSAFMINNSVNEFVFLTQWKSLSSSEAVLHFNIPMDNTALDLNNYEMYPSGKITKVVWENTSQDAVRITIVEASFGALGNPISIRIKNMQSVSGLQTRKNEGDVATFTSYKDDLSEVFVYPNPYRSNLVTEGVYFANLTKQARIVIYSLEGRFIQQLDENDGDGGMFWDLKDQAGNPVHSGVFLYRVDTQIKGVESVIGKFAVLR